MAATMTPCSTAKYIFCTYSMDIFTSAFAGKLDQQMVAVIKVQ